MADTTDTESGDVMQQTWCCLACSTTFRWGEIRLRAGGLRCPRCDAIALHPADGRVEEIGEYAGEIGTLN